jgi:hypothetical protein
VVFNAGFVRRRDSSPGTPHDVPQEPLRWVRTFPHCRRHTHSLRTLAPLPTSRRRIRTALLCLHATHLQPSAPPPQRPLPATPRQFRRALFCGLGFDAPTPHNPKTRHPGRRQHRCADASPAGACRARTSAADEQVPSTHQSGAQRAKQASNNRCPIEIDQQSWWRASLIGPLGRGPAREGPKS